MSVSLLNIFAVMIFCGGIFSIWRIVLGLVGTIRRADWYWWVPAATIPGYLAVYGEDWGIEQALLYAALATIALWIIGAIVIIVFVLISILRSTRTQTD